MAKKILLADDSLTIQKVVELTLAGTDYELTCVSNGQKALASLAAERPDLILADVVMPEKNGYEVCEAVKGNPATARIPVVLLSGTFEPFDRERAERIGCDLIISKPFDAQHLLEEIERFLARAAAAPPPEEAPFETFVEPSPGAEEISLETLPPLESAGSPGALGAPDGESPPPEPYEPSREEPSPAAEAEPSREAAAESLPELEQPPLPDSESPSEDSAEGLGVTGSEPAFLEITAEEAETFFNAVPETAETPVEAGPVGSEISGGQPEIAVEPPKAAAEADAPFVGPEETIPQPEIPAGMTVGPTEPETAVPESAGALPSAELTEEQIERIAARVVEKLSDRVVREIAWEVVPDVAEMAVKRRIAELENGTE
jgi:CheY-like chemotaxis protein